MRSDKLEIGNQLELIGMGKRTAALREELDEPGVEADAIGREEPDVLVGEAEAGGGDCVRLGEARQHGDVDQPLLERHEEGHASHHYTADPVEQCANVRHHLSLALSLSELLSSVGKSMGREGT